MHDWQPDGRFYSWMVCGTCGAPAVCKACDGRGVGRPEDPDVFCPRHAPFAADLRTRVLTGPVIGQRLLRLCQTARDYYEGWSPGTDGQHLRLVVGDLDVWLHHRVEAGWWRVVLLYAGRLVYHAEGPWAALVVKALVPGRWVNEVQHAETWRDGMVVR